MNITEYKQQYQEMLREEMHIVEDAISILNDESRQQYQKLLQECKEQETKTTYALDDYVFEVSRLEEALAELKNFVELRSRMRTEKL